MASVGSRKRTRNGDVKNSGSLEEDGPTRKKPSCTVPAPIMTDEAAQRIRDACDYSIKITMEMGRSGTAPRTIRVYADGIYDMFHSGHARQLMQAKTCFPGNVHLIIGVCNDELTHQMKGRTVMNEAERYEAVRHCRYVDELVTDAPWTLDDEYLQKHKIDFVAHDDAPYGAGGAEDIYKWLKDRDMFVTTQRTEGISTTDVIARIIKDYDMYVRRNLARGYSAKELNVSFMKEKRIQFQEKMEHMKEQGSRLMDRMHNKRDEIFNKWEERSREFVSSFVDLFGREGKINNWMSATTSRVTRAISPPASPRGYDDSDEATSSPPSKRGRRRSPSASDPE